MKNYFNGFITSTCLTASLFLFVGSQNVKTHSGPIVITSEKGTTKIGGGFIEIDGPSGKKIFDVVVGDGNHGELTVYNKNGKSTSKVSAYGDGDGCIKVYNELGKKVIDIKSSSFGGFFSTYNALNKQTSYLGTFQNLKGGLMTYNEKFDLTSFLGTTDQSDGKISLYNNQGNSIVQIGALYSSGNFGDGFVSLHDRYGEYGWHKSGKSD
tara:strand:+ start:169 stop:798 length:630 start_codon:yes stop_codon:yes gene_type:complete